MLVATVATAGEIRIGYRVDAKSGERTRTDGVDERFVSQKLVGEGTLLRRLPYAIGHEARDTESLYEEWSYPTEKLIESEAHPLPTDGAEFRPIRVQGPAANRINLTILGDGYTANEKEKFFRDAERTTRGLFETATFRSFLPLFNVYAVYVPSAESGVGDGSPKNTAFKLYRNPAGSKRAIYPGDERAMERALTLAPKTDYPVVLANDDYYGGLGGRWAISTSSEATGLIVLRHELGHNFGEVGEEYDNGWVYSGANASSSANVPWKHWVEGTTGVHEGKLLSGNYVWQNLAGKPYEASFRFPNWDGSLLVQLSTVGWATPQDVRVALNGQAASYDGVFHADRSFFDLDLREARANETLKLRVEENVRDGDNVLGFALAYAYPPSYDFTPDRVGAFASYAEGGRKTYRPTHNSCLMRDMAKDHFCSVDQENIWLKFLARIELVDGVEQASGAEGTDLRLRTSPLEGLEVRWFAREGLGWRELDALRGRREWSTREGGKFKVRVTLANAEIRKASPRLTTEKEFSVAGPRMIGTLAR